MLNNIIAACLARSRTVLMVLALVLVAGVYSYITIPKEAEPDIPIPIIYVLLIHEGISPEDAERLLVRPMENELRSIEGIKEMTAIASEGQASVILEFEAGFDSEQALDDVREKVDLAKAELPDETEEPTVHEVNLSLFPIIVVTLSGEVPERSLVKLARDLRDKLEGIGEVLEVDIGGDREEVVEIIVDPVFLETYNLSQINMFALARRNNKLVPAGALDSQEGRIPVKVPGLFETVEDILNLPIKVHGDRVVRVSDIAVVRKTFKDAEGFARVNGRPAVTLEVKKRLGENIIATVEKVREAVEAERMNWPAGIEVSYSQDKSRQVRDMLTDLQNNVMSAVVLVMVLVVATLGVRTGLLVGIAIPGSFLAGILALHLMDMSINIVVLFSLILAVGMLVDGAIVVTEFADRKMAEGQPRGKAYLQASQRMAMPITASTVTTLAAYTPLLFWPGIVGEFMKFLPITLIATLSASLVMALIFVPTLGALFGRPGSADPSTMKALAAAEGGNIDNLGGFTGWYVKTLRKILRRPLRVVGIAVASFVGVYLLYAVAGQGLEFFPDVEPDRTKLFVRLRGNLSVREIDKLVREVEERILDIKGFKTIYVRSGISFPGKDIPEDVHGVINLEFEDWRLRRPASEIMEEVRQRTSDLAGIIIEERKEEAGPPVGKPIQIEIVSRNPEILVPAIQAIRRKLDSMQGLRDVDDSRPVPAVEWQIVVDRAEASRYGADITLVGDTIQFITAGLKLGTYRPHDADDEVDIRVRYPKDSRHLDQLERLRVVTASGLVPIKNFVQRRAAPKVGTIERSNSRRVLEASANVEEGVLPDSKVRELKKWLAEEAGLDPRIEVTFKGEDEEQKESQAFLGKAFMVALFVMAIILVTQFNSFYHAFLILTAVVFSTVGVFLGLLLTNQPFGIIMNGIGVISLAGIVVNNNIVLIDTFEYHRRNGAPTFDAVLLTSVQRLRPVLLTAITTILGLLPMVFKLNINFFTREITHGAPSTQWWAQLATSVAFGLAFATLLTLVLTPALLILGDRFYSKSNIGKAEG